MMNVMRQPFGTGSDRTYDGIDLDYEGYDFTRSITVNGQTETVQAGWSATIALLRDSLDAVGSAQGKTLVLTVFCIGFGAANIVPNATVISKVDKFLLVGYELTGAWQGWDVWHGYSIYSRGHTAPGTTSVVGNIDSAFAQYLRRGVPSTKLVITSSASGSVWRGGHMVSNTIGLTPQGGATQPGDNWNPPGGVAPTMTADWGLFDLWPTWSSYPVHHDTSAIAAYWSIDMPNDADDRFISFDDAWTTYKKWEYMKNVRNGGGLVMWAVQKGRIGTGNYPLIDGLRSAVLGDTILDGRRLRAR
jgi:GH18 family chitinase